VSPSDAAALAAAAATLALAWRRSWLAPGAVIAGAVLGLALWWGAGPVGAGLLLFFFVTASVLTRVTRGRRTGGRREAPPSPRRSSTPVEEGLSGGEAADEAAGGTRRGTRQVLANGGVAAAAALLGAWGWLPGAGAAVAGALAAATADTWASELGRWAAGPTRLVTTWERVEPGRSGGVSGAGTLAGLVGAALLGVVHGLLLGSPPFGRALGPALAAGAAGMGLDSLLGASAEGRIRRVDNDVVNLAGTLLGAAVGWLVARGAG